MNYYLAIDIGSTSGRHMVGWMENGEIRQQAVYRFENRWIRTADHITWNLDLLFEEVKKGMKEAFRQFPEIRSLSVDAWGSDYVLMNGSREILPSYTYRDARSVRAVDQVHAIIPFEELYARTGYQFAATNTIYQLYADKLEGRLDQATDFLLMPEYILYRLSGLKMYERTNHFTTSLTDPRTGEYDLELTSLLGFPERLFPKLSAPGTFMGPLLPQIAEETGGSCDVVLCATHDTESAISVIPMEDDEVYISSGTWSLLGTKLHEPITSKEGASAGFSNEAGLSYICYLTNIVGMWIPAQLRKDLCPELSFDEIVGLARKSSYRNIYDPMQSCFQTPVSMSHAIREELKRTGTRAPETVGDYFSCVYRSLADAYRRNIKALERVTGRTFKYVYITGGGARNEFLNELTEEATGKKVKAYPIEASSAGNILMQINAMKARM